MNSRERRKCERRERRAARAARRLLIKERVKLVLFAVSCAVFACLCVFAGIRNGLEKAFSSYGATKTLGTVTPAATRCVWRKTLTRGVVNETGAIETIVFAGWIDIERAGEVCEVRQYREDGSLYAQDTMSEREFFSLITSGEFTRTSGEIDIDKMSRRAVAGIIGKYHPHFCRPRPHPLCALCTMEKDRYK